MRRSKATQPSAAVTGHNLDTISLRLVVVGKVEIFDLTPADAKFLAEELAMHVKAAAEVARRPDGA